MLMISWWCSMVVEMGPAVTKAVVEAGSEGQPTQLDVREVQPASQGRYLTCVMAQLSQALCLPPA